MAHIKFSEFLNEARNPKLTYKEKTARDNSLTQIDVVIDATEVGKKFVTELNSLAKRYKNLLNASTRIKADIERTKDGLLNFVDKNVFDVEDRFVTRKVFIDNVFFTISKTTPLADITETVTKTDFEKVLEQLMEAIAGMDELVKALIKANTTTTVTFIPKEQQKERSPSIKVSESNYYDVNENVISDIYGKVKDWISSIKRIFASTDSKLKALGKTVQKFDPNFEIPDFSEDKIVQTGIREKIMKVMKLK